MDGKYVLISTAEANTCEVTMFGLLLKVELVDLCEVIGQLFERFACASLDRVEA